MGLTLLLVYPLRAWMRNTLCGPETVPQDNRRMIVQHLEVGENHRKVGSGGLWVRTPTTGFSIKSFYICMQRVLGSMKMWILQYDFQLPWSQSGVSKDQHFHEDTAAATWLNGDASALLPPLSLCLWAALCSLPRQHALLLGAVPATGMGEPVPKKAGGIGWKNEAGSRKRQ